MLIVRHGLRQLDFPRGDGRVLAEYLREIRDIPSLSKEREAELGLRIRAGDDGALMDLVTANLKFVVSVARKYEHRGMPLLDLINEGNLGLIRAARHFDAKRQLKFISYAVWWVIQAILHALPEQGRLIPLPHNRVGRLYRIHRAAARVEQDLGHAPSPAELGEAIGMAEEEVREHLGLALAPLSLDDPGRGDEDAPLSQRLRDESAGDPGETAQLRELKGAVEESLAALRERERQVLVLHFGLNGEPPATLVGIGERLGLTRERVRQIKEQALKKLQRRARERDWTDLARA